MNKKPIINPEYMTEFNKMAQLYPTFMNRILERGEWLWILLNRTLNFIKILGSINEFIETLTDDERDVYKKMLQVEKIAKKGFE